MTLAMAHPARGEIRPERFFAHDRDGFAEETARLHELSVEVRAHLTIKLLGSAGCAPSSGDNLMRLSRARPAFALVHHGHGAPSASARAASISSISPLIIASR